MTRHQLLLNMSLPGHWRDEWSRDGAHLLGLHLLGGQLSSWTLLRTHENLYGIGGCHEPQWICEISLQRHGFSNTTTMHSAATWGVHRTPAHQQGSSVAQAWVTI
jgi:hypothetical protein